MERVFAYVNRFIHNLKYKQSRRSSKLTVSELHKAQMTRIKLSQEHYFDHELKKLRRNLPILPHSNNLLSLSPFVNPEGILMVGGRLSQALVPIGA